MKHITGILFSGIITINLHAQSWSQLPDFPGTERDDGVSFVIGNKAYCLSGLETGWQCTRNGYLFDGASENWSNIQSLPPGKERQYAAGFSFHNNGYVLGGVDCNNTCLNDFWQYSPSTDSWHSLPDFPAPGRKGMVSFVLKDKAYIIGGRLTDETVLKEVWEYDFTTFTWTQKNNLPFNGIWRGAGFVIDTLGFVCYGMNNDQSFNRFIYTYAHISDSWSKIPGLTLPARAYIGTAVCNNKVCLYGGLDSLNAVTNDLIVFNPADTSILNYSGIPTVGRKGGMVFSINDVFYITTGLDANLLRIKETWKNEAFLGVKNISNEYSLTLYPNPTDRILYVDNTNFNQIRSTIEIYNNLGQKVIAIPFAEQVDVSELSGGIYLLKITESTGKLFASKFIKAE